MYQCITWLCCVVFMLALAALADAAEPAKPSFNNAAALLTLGQDGQVYLANGDSVLHCRRDGSQLVAGQVGYALRNACANADGVIAAAHAHFAKNVTLHDQQFTLLGRFTRIGDYNYTAPAEVAAGPSGDFYVLDQGRDQVIRFHPDGIRCAVYQIPHEDFPDKRQGYLTRFRVCEQTHSLYVVNWKDVRCFSLDSAAFQYTPKLRWQLNDEGMSASLSWGYGGLDVDERGVLYFMNTTGEEFITSYDDQGKPLQKIPLHMGDHHPVDPTRVLGMCVSQHEVFVKRQHDSELFLRFNLDSGELLTVATLPAEFTIHPPAGVDTGKPIPPVKSTLGIPKGRKTLRVLFVGNSQVNCVRDIPDMLEEISRSSSDAHVPLLLCDEVVVGGVGVEGYWKDGLARQRIAAGGWNYVVMNDIVYSFGVTSKEKYFDYAGKFSELIARAGARSVLFATADVEKRREEHPLMYQDALEFATAHGGKVAGAGMAWLKAWQQQPALDLHFTDRAHPNATGYYLNACVLYATLTDSNPAAQHISTCGAADAPLAAVLQQAAWEQYLEDRKNEKK